ncbi:mechanosensitive ion channel family protein [Marinicella meishanensis]|uniref:mechanosensitive ion channel family protein n=1 Tax=Marinicella meishanensis TaxID=2873263 RepID=UPI001CC155C1|nr:mechanosensitive ion channel family protein [Marinicella sp. NBU2979]
MRTKFILWGLLLSGLSPLLWAQASDETEVIEANESAATTWVDTEQAISVEQTVSDQAIEQRFTRILQVSQRVDEAQVEVTEGVLVLRGKVASEADRKWVEAAANRTEGVIAVVNNISVRAQDQWDLEPAVTEAVSLYQRLLQAMPKITIALIILLLTWLVAKLAFSLGNKVLSKRVNNVFVRRLSARLFALPVVVIGIYLVLKMTGLTNLAMTVIGGTGLLGLVIGIAFKDIAENFLASILISIQRPFKIGDYIRVDGHQGVVQSVTTRGTVIMTLEGNHIHIPNAIIYKNTIVNVTANPNIRKQFMVGIGYDDPITQAQEIALQVLSQHPAVLNDPEPQVLVDNLGAATVNLKVLFWVNGEENSASKVKSAVIRLIKRAYDEAAISMPDEAREVVFPEGIHITQEPPKEAVKAVPAKPAEPSTSQVEADLSNDVDEIRKQSAENQLQDDANNLIKDG